MRIQRCVVWRLRSAGLGLAAARLQACHPGFRARLCTCCHALHRHSGRFSWLAWLSCAAATQHYRGPTHPITPHYTTPPTCSVCAGGRRCRLCGAAAELPEVGAVGQAGLWLPAGCSCCHGLHSLWLARWECALPDALASTVRASHPAPASPDLPNHCSNSLYPFSLKKVGGCCVGLVGMVAVQNAGHADVSRPPLACFVLSSFCCCMPWHRECPPSWHAALTPPACCQASPPSRAAFLRGIPRRDLFAQLAECAPAPSTPAPPPDRFVPHSCNCCCCAGAVRQAGAQRQRRRGAPPQAGAEPRHHARQHLRGKLGVGLCLVACTSWCPAARSWW